jgi:PII-like signaling protein
MELNQAAKRLRVYLGEANRMKHTALHEVLIRETRGKGSGGTDPARSGDVPS